MIDHHSYTQNLTVVKLKLEKIQAWTGFEPMTSAIPVQCSTNWAIIKPLPFYVFYFFRNEEERRVRLSG